MSAKHTPGPWLKNGSYIYSADRKILAVVHNPGEKASDYPLIPNRDLMAAAPELLEALKLAFDYFNRAIPGDHRKMEAYYKAEAAIRKAEEGK